ncbi:MAG TPA: FUSC family protein [Acidobacteriaceae bacterium]
MRLKAHKSWAQEQLATKLRMGPEDDRRLFSWERQRLLIHAAKTALAAGLCWWLALLFGLHEGYWGAISAIIVLQSNVGSTVTASRDRILGTVIGAIVGFSFSLFGTLPWNYVLAVLTAVIICGLLGLRNSSRLAGVTISIVMLVKAGSHWSVAMDRVIDVFLGIVVALTVSAVLLPDRARLRLREGLAREFLLLGNFFEAILQGFRSEPAENLTVLRQDVLAVVRSNAQLAEAARNEPSGSPGMREALGLLSQFGRSLLDALVALEFAVQDSHHDAFAQQLEPALGKLATDVLTGFHHVAGCIHDWSFHIPPPDLSLEEDIAALEARMDEVRHNGKEFPQAEILRAYAVQLHLKQIARLLRASRVETSLAMDDPRE